MLCVLALWLAAAPVLQVGDGKAYSRIEDAVAAASAGSTIEVFPKASGYAKTAVKVSKPNIKIVAHDPVEIDGAGFAYSGVGSTPRAIFQIDPDGDGAVIAGFILKGAHNDSHNGAGVRINGADNVWIANCEIFGNDMGIMSNGPGARDQTILRCHIHHNGDLRDPGYNHNLYLGGDSVSLVSCEVDHALTGHNLKSRAHFTKVENSVLHHSANREVDLVESEATVAENSNAAIVNSLILKLGTGGNGNAIHFGRERGSRNGTLFILGSTIVTNSVAPVVLLSDPIAKLTISHTVVASRDQALPVLIAGAGSDRIQGKSNWIHPKFNVDATGLTRLSVPADLPSAFWRTYKLDTGEFSATTFVDGEGKKCVGPRHVGCVSSKPFSAQQNERLQR